jgi:hypothetical protein
VFDSSLWRWPQIRRTLAITGVVVLLALFGWFWWLGVPMLYRSVGGGPDIENVRLNATVTTRAALLAGLVGLGALGTFWLNSRVYRITARTFEVAERGQLTDRYSKAIEQLGSETLDVRLGGIYALEQIATDSPRTRDQATIVEVLSAFVRVHSDPIYQYKTVQPNATNSDELFAEAATYVEKRMKPPLDVQAAVTVLGRLPPLEGVARGDLQGAWLAHSNIDGANLTGAQLNGANLTGVQLNGANLTGTQLVEVNLTGAWLHGANLTGAQLHGVNLTDALLFRVDLTGAKDLSQEQVDTARGDRTVMLPTLLPRPEKWLDGEAPQP